MSLLKNKYNLLLIFSYSIILFSFYFFALPGYDKVILYIINFNLCFLLSLLLFHLNKNKKEFSLKDIILISLTLRIITIFVNPVTSDDHFRYFWDGKVQASGINPYQFSPLELTSLQDSLIYPNVSFPEIKTIYPPLSEMVFYLGYEISSTNASGLKLIYLILETGILYFIFSALKLLKTNTNYIFLYSFSPLIVFEFFINAHIDILILFFLSGFIFFALRGNAGFAFLFLSLSVLSKTYSIIFLPLYLFYFLDSGSKAKKIITAVFFFMLPFVILIFYGKNIVNVFITMQNYLQHWYFNNLLYVLINSLLKFFEVDNHAYARVILIIFFIISYGLILKSRFTFLQKICFVSISYLLFSHTVHPWYLTLPVLLLPLYFTSSSIFWSGFIVFTNLTVYFYLKDNIWEDILLVLVPEFCILVILIIADIKRITSLNETKKFR